MTTRIDYYSLNRPAFDALGTVGKHVASIEPKLRALVELRVSQINGCGYCVDVHSTQARSHGETQQRLDCLPAWWECDFFDPAECAALRWAEAVTNISHSHAPDELFQALKPHYSEQQIVDLTLIISVMNAWNRIAIAHHKHPMKRSAAS
jgi:AhpD family alkylhydroperoxidase